MTWLNLIIGILVLTNFIFLAYLNDMNKENKEAITSHLNDLLKLNKRLEKVLGYDYSERTYKNPESIDVRLLRLENDIERIDTKYNNLKEIKTARLDNKIKLLKEEIEGLENE